MQSQLRNKIKSRFWEFVFLSSGQNIIKLRSLQLTVWLLVSPIVCESHNEKENSRKLVGIILLFFFWLPTNVCFIHVWNGTIIVFMNTMGSLLVLWRWAWTHHKGRRLEHIWIDPCATIVIIKTTLGARNSDQGSVSSSGKIFSRPVWFQGQPHHI